MNTLTVMNSASTNYKRCFHLGLLLIVLAISSVTAGAQPLSPNLCPVGSPIDYRPSGLTRFSGAGFPMLKRTLDAAAYPDAVCNDGSPGVMYFRPANHANPNSPPSNKWLIFFDGGGGCRNADDCLLTRFCSGGGEIFSRAGKMSSQGAFPAINAPGGIWNVTPPGGFTNHLADYNQVLVHYCSSDNWIGSQTHTGLSTSTGVNFDIQFEGEAIVNAVIETLLAGPVTPDLSLFQWRYRYYLPPLGNATDIVFGAESAGANGLKQHIDRLRDWLVPVTEANIAGLLDAAFIPWQGDPGIDWSNSPVPGYEEYLTDSVEPVLRDFWGVEDSAMDASCLDNAHQAAHDAAGLHPQICYDNEYLLLNHITTPIFQRMDIDDPLAQQRFVDWMLYSTPDDYWLAQYTQLVNFSNYSPAGGGLEAPDAAPGVQGPNCRQHVGVQNNAGFFGSRVIGPAYPAPLSMNDLFGNWLAGAFSGPNTVQIQDDNLALGAYSASFCF